MTGKMVERKGKLKQEENKFRLEFFFESKS
jgi:hypothetical protein